VPRSIAPERFGLARLTHLDERERTLYRCILASFARAAPPQVDELCDRASELDLPLEETLDLFATLDLSITTRTQERSSSPIRSPLGRGATPCSSTARIEWRRCARSMIERALAGVPLPSARQVDPLSV
jgi:hypothetical protein